MSPVSSATSHGVSRCLLRQPGPESVVPADQGLQGALPQYYARHVKPQEEALRRRPGPWFLPPGGDWQQGRQPKLVVPRVTSRGRFAYDETGEFIVVDGYALFWRREGDALAEDEEGPPVAFAASPLPWAYVALLNSPVFQVLLGHFCSSLHGSYRLSQRELHVIPLPNLADSGAVSAEAVRSLADLGQAMAHGEPPTSAALALAAARAYGVALADWGLNEQGC